MDRRSGSLVWRLLGLAGLSAGLALLVGVARGGGLVPPGLNWAAALLPVAPLLAYFLALHNWLRALDEMQRLIQFEALFLQFAITALLIVGYGVLAEARAVPDLPVSRIWPWLWVSLFLSWAFGQAVVRRRYL